MSEILDEYGEKRVRRFYKNRSTLRMIAIGVFVIIFGIYIGDMLFGKSSLDVLINLQDSKESLEKKVKELKRQNAHLQKEYFELKQLDPDSP